MLVSHAGVRVEGVCHCCRPGRDPDAVEPGIFGPAELPHLTRTDYVANSNGSPGLVNPAQPLAYPRIVGDTGAEQRPRHRLAIDMISQRVAGTDGLGTPGFTPTHWPQQRWAIVASSASNGVTTWSGSATPTRHWTPPTQPPVDVRAACDVPAGWDLHVNLDSRGEVLFREFFHALVNRPARLPPEEQWAAVPFNPNQPLTTPRGLNTTLPEVGHSLADAVQDMAAHRTILTYGESDNPTSPHHRDQAPLFSNKRWVTERFAETEINTDPHLTTTVLHQW